MKTKILPYYLFFMVIYFFLSIHNYQNKSGWLFDSIIAIILVSTLFIFTNALSLKKFNFFLINLAFLLHNIGTFGLYSFKIDWFMYDDIVHLFGAFVASYAIFNTVANKLEIKINSNNNSNLRHIFLISFLVITLTVFLGTVLEVLEYYGFTYLGEGEGVLFTGNGDYNKFGDIKSQYVDTMQDIIMNTIGALFGTLFYYFAHFRKRINSK